MRVTPLSHSNTSSLAVLQWLNETKGKTILLMRVTPLSHSNTSSLVVLQWLNRRLSRGKPWRSSTGPTAVVSRLGLAWRGAASSEGCLLGLERRHAAAVLLLGLARRSKLRRVSSGPGVESPAAALWSTPTGPPAETTEAVFLFYISERSIRI